MMVHSYTMEEARKIVLNCAKQYNRNLLGKKYIIIFRDRVNNEIKYIEVYFGKENYQHLTGIELVDQNRNIRKNVSELFYTKCINNSLRKDEIQFKKDGTTNLKLQALPVMMAIQKVTKIAGDYDGSRPYLIADKLIGNVNFCLGLKYIGNTYVPASALLEDIKRLTTIQSQVLAILSKESQEVEYTTIRHVAKGIDLNCIKFPKDLEQKISLANYES